VARTQVIRANRPLLLVDVAVPRDIDQAVKDIPGVTLFDIDDLKDVIDANHGRREAAAVEVEAIIAQELEQNIRWLQSREIVPLIVDLRKKAEAIAEAEVEQARHKLHSTDARDQALIEQMAARIVNKLLHGPTTALKAHAGSSDAMMYAQVTRELFELDHLNTLTPTHRGLASLDYGQQTDAGPLSQPSPSGRGEQYKAEGNFIGLPLTYAIIENESLENAANG
jgi:glutamyl-tRNA reductase